MLTSHQKLGLALGVAGVCLFGGTLPATRHAVVSFDPFFLSTARAVVAGLLGVAALILTRRSWPARRTLTELLTAGVLTVFVFPILLALGMQTVPASHGGVVLGIVPLGTAIAAAVLAHERPSAGFWATSAAGSAIVLAFVFWRTGEFAFEAGDSYLLGVVVAGSLGYTMSGKLSARMPGWEVISWQVALYLPVTLAASIVLWPGPDFAPTPAAWAGFAYVSTISMFSAFIVMNFGMALAGIARVGQLNLLQPFVILAMSIPINGEPFEPVTVLFAGAVVATVLIGQRMRVTTRP